MRSMSDEQTRIDDPVVHHHALPAPFLSDEEVARLVQNIGDAAAQAAGMFQGMTVAVGQLGVVFRRHQQLILRAAYRGGLLPWPSTPHPYQHRARWAGRRPRR
jgi:hypothetical protein